MLENNLILTIIHKQIDLLHRFLSPYFVFASSLLTTLKPWLLLLLLISITAWLVYWLIKVYLTWQESRKPVVLFEVSPPTSTEQSSYTTTQLFSSVYGLLRQKSWTYRLFDVGRSYSFEIVSTKEKGIRYLLRVSSDDGPIVKKNLIAYLPGIQVKESLDYLDLSLQAGHVVEIEASNNFAFPLKKQDNLEEYDPIAYVTGTMTKLVEDELVAVQMVIAPTGQSVAQVIRRLRSLFLTDRDVLTELKGSSPVSSILVSLIYFALQILLFPIGLMIWIFTGGREGPLLPIVKFDSKTPDSTYKDIIETQIKQKIDQPIFTTSLRLLTVSSSRTSQHRIEKGFVAALSPFTNGGYQSLKPKRYLKLELINKCLLWLYSRRLPNLFGNLVLSATEVSDLYHFPFTSTTKTENLSKLHSKELPAPLSLKTEN